MTGAKLKAERQRSPSEQEIAALTALFQSGHVEDAKSAAQTLIAKYPKHGFGWKVLGVIHQDQGNHAESLIATQKALALLPNDASVHNNLATALLGLGRMEEAEACIQKALTIAPAYVKALNNYGSLLRHQGKHAQAERFFRRALEADPDNALTHIRLGNALELQNKLHNAHESYRAALGIDPAMKFIHSDLLHLMSLDAEIGPQQLFAEHRAFGEQLEAMVSAKRMPHTNSKEAARRLKIGFVTADLYDHALANYFEPLFGHLIDKQELSIHIYYNNTQSDAVTTRLRDFLTNWHAVSELSDDELAAKIRDDGIDILVDLNGHTVLNRLAVFAQKPAPVQISWLGYLGTTGLRSMDYYVADSYWIPPGKLDWQFTEKLAYLPAVVAFEPNHYSPPVNPLPALGNGYITFGSFNRQNKINPSVVRTWSALLKRFPSAKMILGAIPQEHQENIAKLFECEGISKSRLTFFGRMAQTDYLALHHKVDFCLDTFPFGGGATTAHAAWMGVPTLSLVGETPASRFGATEMHHLDLDTFIATSEDDFIAKGTYWAEHAADLADIRQNLRTRFQTSPLGQYQAFADGFAAMLRAMWLRWCADEPPKTITADAIASHILVNQAVTSVDPPVKHLRTLNRLFGHMEYAKAELLAKELIEKYPDHGLARKVLGSTLHHLGRLDEALATHKATVEARPNDYEAHFNLAAEYHQQGMLDESVKSYIHAIGLQPNNPNAYNNVGNIFKTMGLFPQAEMYCRQAVALQPNMARAYNNLGNALHAQGKYTESIASYQQALALKPDWAEAYNNLAITLKDQGHSSEAQQTFHKALQLKPDWAAAHSNYLYCLSLDVHTTPDQLHAEHRAFGQKFEPALRKDWQPHANANIPNRVIHVGFVSGDLYDHALANFFEPAFECLSTKPDLVLHAYCNHIYDDAVTKRMRSSFEHWHCVAELTDSDLANRIRADGIDILFDLSGHTAHNRLLTFARKPAPIQVSWLGYLGTSGLDAMDYYLCDTFWIPPGELDWQLCEKPAYIPSAVTFKPSPHAPLVNALPALTNGHITFGSFNRTNKLNPSVVVLWSMLLRNVPNAKMVFGGIPTESQLELFHRFADEGIAPERLTFFPRANLQEYLTLHHQVDFCLDTFPYGGGATTAHAAWMGVPSLSLAGESPPSRFGASTMHHLGLDDFIATSIEDYLAKGHYWSEHIPELALIRQSLRERFDQSDIGQHAAFADNLHAMLRTMWTRQCDGLPPAMLEVTAKSPGDHGEPKSTLSQPSEEVLQSLLTAYQTNQHTEAEHLARALTEQFPHHELAWRILGYVCIAQGRYQDALEPLRQALVLEPTESVTHLNLGQALTSLNALADAEVHIRKAIALSPNYGKAYVNLGMVLRLHGKFDESESACRRALEIDPDDASAHIQLGNALEDQSRLSEAQASYYRADMAHEPRKAVAHSNVLYLLNHDVLVEPQHLFAEHVAFGEQFEKPLRQYWPEHKNSKDECRALNVGFVSGDLNHHALAHFLLPVFKRLSMDPSLVLHAYYTHTIEDDATQHMRPCFTQWHAVAQLNDLELSEQVQADNIDILFDLSGHTKNNRLLTFARKPAPIQISWLGYLGTTGLRAMDYYLCDPYWIPPGVLDWQFTEKTLYLPAAVTFQPDPLAPPVIELPALNNRYITFGSFNRVSKINESVLVLWSMVMQSVPDSRLILGAIEPESQARVLQSFERQGVAPQRISFFPRTHTVEYLTLHHQVDLCLDTFPHGGGATTAHAAWMGVPTLCMAGETPASRLSATLMHHLKLDRFVATGIDDYVAIGVYWSQHIAELGALRAGLRTQFVASPLGQTESFSDQLGATLRGIWRQWCQESSRGKASDGTQAPTRTANDTAPKGPASSAAVELTEYSQELTSAIPALIQLASSNQAAGQLPAARVLYLEVLKMVPKHDLANHNLGVIEGTLNGVSQALPLLETAIQENPQCEQYWISYINALMQSGAIDTAASAIEWGQKYGLKSETANAMAADFVAALERMREPPPATEVDLDEFPGSSPAPDWPSPRLSQTADLDYITPPRSSGRRYVIFAPLYRHNSAGIRVMFELQKWLILAGYDAIVIAGTKDYAISQFADDIVIYPEVVPGNPLKTKRVVRYILNAPGKLGGTKKYAQHELLVAYSAALAQYAGGNVLQTPSIESIFYRDDRVKTTNAVYVGKGQDLQLHPKDCVHITGSFPATRFEVAEFMRSVKTLYTYDSFSVIAHEAMLCGCEVKLIDKNGTIDTFPDPCHTPLREFKAQLHDFIEMTKLL